MNNDYIIKAINKRIAVSSSIQAFLKNDTSYACIKLPDSENVSVYGVLGQGDTIFYSPVYILVKEGILTDILTTFEYSRAESLINKSCYVDDNYIFHVKSFSNIDGFEVETGVYEKYKINANGRFVKYYVKNGLYNTNFARGNVMNNTNHGNWIELSFADGSSKPNAYTESKYDSGILVGQKCFYEIIDIKNNRISEIKQGKLLYTETYKNGILEERKFLE